MTLPPPSSPDRPELGIPLMLLTALCLTLLDSCAKSVTGQVSLPMIAWARYTSSAVILLLAVAPRHSVVGLLRTRRLGLHMLRGLTLVGATLFIFASVKYLPLTDTYAITFVTPMLVAVLSVPILGERVRPAQWLAIFSGFAGVLVVIRPGFGSITWPVVLPLLMASSYAIYQVLTRITGFTDPPLTALLYTNLFGAVVLSIAAPFFWSWPAPETWAALIGTGLLGTIGHLCLIKALSVAPASLLAPFSYSQILWGLLIGYLWFGNRPDPATLIGAALVVASGLWLGRLGTAPTPVMIRSANPGKG
ncbi:MAG: EamA family transporter [Azospirillum sp.]|nr:EamA family transporter [Azospirillum sp.]